MKISAGLHNFTGLKPVIPNVTRWSGKPLILSRLVRIRNEFLEAGTAQDAYMAVNGSLNFAIKIIYHKRMLQEVNFVTKLLQNSGYTLSKCGKDLDVLNECVQAENLNADSPFHQFSLIEKFISPRSQIFSPTDFESRFVKIISNFQDELTDEDKFAVSSFRICLDTANSPTG